jgi:D-3-phosphoglycerate dehydrogenase
MSHIRTRVLMADAEQLVAGALFGMQRDGRITEINGFRLEAIPRGHLLVTRNRDVPGVIGRIGSALGERGVNISSFHLGRQERGGEAMAVIETDAPLGKTRLIRCARSTK